MSILTDFEAAAQKNEQWLVAEVQKGWTLLQSAEQTIALDLTNIFGWLQAHQQTILATAEAVLKDIAGVALAIPSLAPAAAIATTTIDAATAAIDALNANFQAGATPLSTITSAYSVTKAAASAVNDLLVAKTSMPSTATTIPTVTPAAA